MASSKRAKTPASGFVLEFTYKGNGNKDLVLYNEYMRPAYFTHVGKVYSVKDSGTVRSIYTPYMNMEKEIP